MKFQFWRRRPNSQEVDVVDLNVAVPWRPMPHCDNLILHAPGRCTYCDRYPEAQALRDWWHIGFTNHHDPDRLPCPSTILRSAQTRDMWGGNVAVAP